MGESMNVCPCRDPDPEFVFGVHNMQEIFGFWEERDDHYFVVTEHKRYFRARDGRIYRLVGNHHYRGIPQDNRFCMENILTGERIDADQDEVNGILLIEKFKFPWQEISEMEALAWISS